MSPDNPAADETLKRTQSSIVLSRHKTDRISNGLGTTCSTDSMNVVLGMHRKVVVDDMGDAIDVDSASGDIRRHQHLHGP